MVVTTIAAVVFALNLGLVIGGRLIYRSWVPPETEATNSSGMTRSLHGRRRSARDVEVECDQHWIRLAFSDGKGGSATTTRRTQRQRGPGSRRTRA